MTDNCSLYTSLKKKEKERTKEHLGRRNRLRNRGLQRNITLKWILKGQGLRSKIVQDMYLYCAVTKMVMKHVVP